MKDPFGRDIPAMEHIRPGYLGALLVFIPEIRKKGVVLIGDPTWVGNTILLADDEGTILAWEQLQYLLEALVLEEEYV